MAYVTRRADELRRRGRQRAEHARYVASRLDRRTLLRHAWALARDSVRRFGGAVRAYLAAAFRQAWGELKARRAVAAAMAEDRRAMEGSFFQLTVPGVLVLREAGE
jgi:Streptococcus thermophilus bacteriophage Gp111 protein